MVLYNDIILQKPVITLPDAKLVLKRKTPTKLWIPDLLVHQILIIRSHNSLLLPFEDILDF